MSDGIQVEPDKAEVTRRAFERLGRYAEALERLADPDTPVLDEGLGGGDTEELHVRVNLARQVLGKEVCGCTECMVSLGLDDEDGRHPDGCPCRFCREDERDARAQDDDADDFPDRGAAENAL